MTMRMPTACADCGGPLERGYVLDHAHMNNQVRARWVQGEPDVGFWNTLRVRGHRQIAIRAYRCTDCGLLRQYALDEDAL